MNALHRRLRKLETKLVLPVDLKGMHLVELLRARRRRCLAAEGQEPEIDPFQEDDYDASNRPRTIAEALR
jgi:hypothetical protein